MTINIKHNYHILIKVTVMLFRQIKLRSGFLTRIHSSLVDYLAQVKKAKKLSHPFWVCFELGMGIVNAPCKILLVVYEPILKLQGLQGIGFQGKIELKLRVKLITFLPYEGFKWF